MGINSKIFSWRSEKFKKVKILFTGMPGIIFIYRFDIYFRRRSQYILLFSGIELDLFFFCFN